MKRITLLFLLFVWASVISSAQIPTLPEQCQAFYPELLQTNPVLKEADANDFMKKSNYGQRNKAPRNKTFWVVYSDRADNVTYTEPGGKVEYSTLDFNQRLRIAQIKDSYALVYDEPMQAIEYPLISKDAVCKGWIPMKNLLLWHNCLANERGIYNKALLCFNLDKADKDNASYGQIYKNPSDKRNFEQGTTDLNFYFVMKREGNLSLLAKSHTMEGTSDKVLLGWVSEQSYVAWNQRSCLEPTWDTDDVEYFVGKNDTIRVYSDKELTTPATRVPFFMRDISDDKYNKMDPMQRKFIYRMSPFMLRFPILDGSTSTLYNCNSFGSVSGEVVYGDSADNGDPLRITEQKLKALTNINICLCIDGTASMESFYPAVVAAIKDGVKTFKTNAKVRVGAVIYRDYVDGPEYVQEIFPLTSPDNERFFDFLRKGGEYGIKSSSKDRTLEEALYNGINTALDSVGFKPDQSNILFVIGDCGNARSDTKFTKDSLVRKIVDKNVHVMGFQVRTGSEDAFALFIDQMIDIIYESLEIKYKALHEGKILSVKNTQDGYNLENDVNSLLHIGSLYYPYKVKNMDLTKLTSLMVQSFQYCNESVEHKIDILNPLNIGGFRRNTKDISQKIDENFVISRIGEDMYRELLESNSLVGFKGYAKKNSESGRSYFKTVLFISADEFTALLEDLAPVKDVAEQVSNDREPYVRAMKALAQSMIPEDLTDERLGSMGYSEIMSLVAGLNEAADALKGNFTIDEIASPQKISLTVYQSLVTNFVRKFKDLQKIANSKYEYTREINGVKYFWLPIEALP